MDKSRRSSFTMIEVLVVATIGIVLSGISLAVFVRYRDEQALNHEIVRFTQLIELAKAKSIAGDTSQCSTDRTAYISGYRVEINPSTMQLIPHCNTSPTPLIQFIHPQIIFITPTFSLSFNQRGYSGVQVCIPITNKSGDQCRVVSIHETGPITQNVCSSCSPLVCPCP